MGVLDVVSELMWLRVGRVVMGNNDGAYILVLCLGSRAKTNIVHEESIVQRG